MDTIKIATGLRTDYWNSGTVVHDTRDNMRAMFKELKSRDVNYDWSNWSDHMGATVTVREFLDSLLERKNPMTGAFESQVEATLTGAPLHEGARDDVQKVIGNTVEMLDKLEKRLGKQHTLGVGAPSAEKKAFNAALGSVRKQLRKAMGELATHKFNLRGINKAS